MSETFLSASAPIIDKIFEVSLPDNNNVIVTFLLNCLGHFRDR